MDGTAVADEPRVHLIGYGPSSSTVGANRAGRDAVLDIVELLGRRSAAASGPPPTRVIDPEPGMAASVSTNVHADIAADAGAGPQDR